jgi:single-stranded DNA-binding protein
VTVWDKLAEYDAESLRKGDRVLVTGQVHTEARTDREGAKRTKQVITNAKIGASPRFTTVAVTRSQQAPTSS